jgi:hypothetical protein
MLKIKMPDKFNSNTQKAKEEEELDKPEIALSTAS